MTKKKSRKTNKKFRIFIICFIFALIIGFILILLGAYVFETKVKTIIVHNNTILTDNEIVTIANLDNYPNFYLTTCNSIEQKIENNTFIKNAIVKKKLFFEIDIYIEEYKPLFVREDTNKIVFNTGKEIINKKEYTLHIPSLINYVPDTKYNKLISKMNKIDYKILTKISDIKYYPSKYDEDRFVLYMNDSNRVMINLPKFRSLNKYDEMVTKLEGKTGVLYLDSGNYFEID